MPSHVSKVNAELPSRTEPHILLNLLGWHDCLFEDGGEALVMPAHCVDHFREHNLRLKPTKCKFFKNEINYLAHHISREGVQPSKENLKAVAEFATPQTCTEILAFLGLVGQYGQFIKGFACIVQPLYKYLSGEGAGKKNEWVTLTEGALGTFELFKKACLESPVLAFADFNKPFLLETDTSKLGLGAVLSQKQTDSQYHLVPYASWSLTFHKHKLSFKKTRNFSIKVGNCRAISGTPTLETIHCQDQQQSHHLHHDYT